MKYEITMQFATAIEKMRGHSDRKKVVQKALCRSELLDQPRTNVEEKNETERFAISWEF